MSKTVDVYVKLPHGIIVGHEGHGIGTMAMDSARIALDQGFNENVPRALIESWLKKNSQLACVRRGDVRIINHDVLAVDSGASNRKK